MPIGNIILEVTQYVLQENIEVKGNRFYDD